MHIEDNNYDHIIHIKLYWEKYYNQKMNNISLAEINIRVTSTVVVRRAEFDDFRTN